MGITLPDDDEEELGVGGAEEDDDIMGYNSGDKQPWK